MHHPTKAVILAAGFGTRMMPISALVPKPMLLLGPHPLLHYHLSMLRRWGVNDVLINLHHQPDSILAFLRAAGGRYGLRITCSFEPDILGTGGALSQAAWFFDDQPFWMINADIVVNLDPAPIRKALKAPRIQAALWLTADSGPRTVAMSHGVIENFRSSRPFTEGTYTFTGLHLIHPHLLRYLPSRGFSSIIDAYDKAMADGHRIAGVTIPGSRWADVGTPHAYLEACKPLDHSNADTWRTFAPSAIIDRRAKIAGSVVMADAVIGPRAAITAAIIAPGTRVDGPVHDTIAMAGSDYPEPFIKPILAHLEWRPEHTCVAAFAPRGSARRFFRLQYRNQRAILIHYSLERPENSFYVPNARLLHEAGIAVPAIQWHDARRQLTVMNDLGDDSLLGRATGLNPAALLRLYRPVIGLTARLHREATPRARAAHLRLMRPFTRSLFVWEHNFFAEHFLAGRLKLEETEYITPLRELAGNARILEQLPRVLVHRDLQSTNIIFHRGRPFLIDFQGMRFGPALYDLASLLADPYISLPETVQMKLLARYRTCSGDDSAVPELFWRATIQRLVQALGAYGRLGANPATAEFARHIPPALTMLSRALSHVDGLPFFTELIARAP